MDQPKREERFGGLTPNYKYDGITYQPVLFQKETLKKIEQTNFKSDDIFIAAYPKCGMYHILHLSYAYCASVQNISRGTLEFRRKRLWYSVLFNLVVTIWCILLHYICTKL